MITTTIFPGRYVQGPNSIDRVGEEIYRYGSNGLFICSPFVYNNIISKHEEKIKKHIKVSKEKFSGECTDEEIDRLVTIGKEVSCNVIIGMGGGKVIDTAKAVAYLLDLPAIIIPTIASNDAPCSALAVIYTQSGEFKRYLFLPKNPQLVLLDSNIITNAPTRFLVAGMGDALATWFEAESCKKKSAGNMTGDLGSMTAYALANLCYKTLLKYGVQAKLDCELHITSTALENVIEANTLLSGLGFESGGLAAAHAIHNGFTALKGTHSYYHGEKVAFGTLASLFIGDKSPELINEVYNFCTEINLPITLSDIGLSNISDEELMKVADMTCNEGETIYNEPMNITPKIVFNSLKMADAYGRNLKLIKKQ